MQVLRTKQVDDHYGTNFDDIIDMCMVFSLCTFIAFDDIIDTDMVFSSLCMCQSLSTCVVL